MMRPCVHFWLLLGVALLSQGCLIRRTIDDLAVHPSYNSYKVVTSSVRTVWITSWIEHDAWNCNKVGERFRCAPISYEASKHGVPGTGATAQSTPAGDK